jgi:hypothetical protein
VLFDTLAGIVERHLPEFISTMREARIFRLDPHEDITVTGAVERWEPDERTVENFRLPFSFVAIEEAERRDSPSSVACNIFPSGTRRPVNSTSYPAETEAMTTWSLPGESSRSPVSSPGWNQGKRRRQSSRPACGAETRGA